jgi:dienelactone hydrolase
MNLNIAAGLAAIALSACNLAAARADVPERLTFPSNDGKTTLVGYLFKPQQMPAARVPAVVMMHGRGGAYSSSANGIHDASTLSKRHQAWGRLWVQAGFIAILVDGFGPRGYPQGFPRFSYKDRPADVDEVSMRPLDAYGALAYLRSRPDVVADRIALHGWSNGGSATLSAMSADTGSTLALTAATGFRAAIAFYPACGLKDRFRDGYRPYAPVRVFHGTADEEVSSARCRRFVEASRSDGGDIEIREYRGATHGFDDPGQRRQRIRANREAAEDAMERAQSFLAERLGAGRRSG